VVKYLAVYFYIINSRVV